MSELAKTTILIVGALFPIVNPLGNCPIFLALTPYYTTSARSALAWRIAVNSFILLIVSFLIGTHVLSFFGISLPVVQIGGGLVVISTGWTMLKYEDPGSADVGDAVKPRDVSSNAFYPLTLPLTVGPGSISVAIALGANEPRYHGVVNLLGLLAALIGSLLIAVSIFLCYGFAERLGRLLGASAMNVIMRLSSFLLVCIGVQILWNGVKALLVTLPPVH
jgi:multiple antibiotic resistance protein